MKKDKLIECRITKEQLKVLNDTFCVYKNGTKTGEIPVNCDECILRGIDYIIKIPDVECKWDSIEIVKDLCFAIYHDKILTKNPKHYHHNF